MMKSKIQLQWSEEKQYSNNPKYQVMNILYRNKHYIVITIVLLHEQNLIWNWEAITLKMWEQGVWWMSKPSMQL